MAQPFEPAKPAAARESAEAIQRSCRALMAEHQDPLAPLRVDLALAVACENYQEAARCATLRSLAVSELRSGVGLLNAPAGRAVSPHQALQCQHAGPGAPARGRALAMARENYQDAAQ